MNTTHKVLLCELRLRMLARFVFEFGFSVISLRGNATMYCTYINHENTHTHTRNSLLLHFLSLLHIQRPILCHQIRLCVRAIFCIFDGASSYFSPSHPFEVGYQFMCAFFLFEISFNLFIHSNFEVNTGIVCARTTVYKIVFQRSPIEI